MLGLVVVGGGLEGLVPQRNGLKVRKRMAQRIPDHRRGLAGISWAKLIQDCSLM